MSDYRVMCVTKPDRFNTHEHITELGGIGWTEQVNNVIAHIENGTHTFFTFEGGKRAEVGVVRENGKAPFVRTHADGYWRNDLLDLRACPVR